MAIGDLLDMLCHLARVEITIERDPARLRPSDAPVMRADTARLRQATGWQPEISLERSLNETVAWWRANLTPSPFRPSGVGRGDSS